MSVPNWIKDVELFADGLISTIRSWNESIFFGALSNSRTVEERTELIEAYYSTYQSQVAQNPTEHGMGYVHAYTTISKIS